MPDAAATTPKHVLLVEDSSVTKDLVELVLTQSGHAVTSVDTGQKALDALRGGRLDVVLTDFHLPDLTGLDVVRRFLRDMGDRPRPLFVAITGDTRGLLRDEDCELFDRVVPKPLDIDLVCELVVAPPHPATAPPRPAPGPAPAAGAATDGWGLALLEWPSAPAATRPASSCARNARPAKSPVCRRRVTCTISVAPPRRSSGTSCRARTSSAPSAAGRSVLSAAITTGPAT